MAFLPLYAPESNPGIEHARDLTSLIALQEAVKEGVLPTSFPTVAWAEQSERYLRYWSWFRGDKLNEVADTDKDGNPIYQMPLRINPIRDFARKHAGLLFGEVPDTPAPLVKMLVTPKTVLHPHGPSETAKDKAVFFQSVLNEIWMASNGRSLQLENGLLSQALGGCIFKLEYQPWRKDLLIPIVVRNVYPDFFLPVWSQDDYYNLLEVFIVYRMTPHAAKLRYGVESKGPTSLYVEHWTRTHYSISVDGEPLVANFNGKSYPYSRRPNPYGFIPMVYIPRLREGNLYGSSMVDDVSGLAEEYNYRFADVGDAVRDSVHRMVVGRNISADPVTRPLDKDGSQRFVDIGQSFPGSTHEPELDVIDPPTLSDGLVNQHKDLWSSMLRMASLGPIAFGEDEGSQRSALTLAFRMWPSTVVTRMQRSFWSEGLTVLARYQLEMMAALNIKVGDQRVTREEIREFDIGPDWLPIVPRDREAQVAEIMTRLQIGAISLEKALTDLGDTPDVEAEVKLIYKHLMFRAQLAAMGKPSPGGSDGSQSSTQPDAKLGLNKDGEMKIPTPSTDFTVQTQA